MNRTLLFPLILAFSLAMVGPVHANINGRHMPAIVKSSPFAALILPIKLFVNVTQAPATVFKASVTGILRQLLLGSPRSPGRTLGHSGIARI